MLALCFSSRRFAPRGNPVQKNLDTARRPPQSLSSTTAAGGTTAPGRSQRTRTMARSTTALRTLQRSCSARAVATPATTGRPLSGSLWRRWRPRHQRLPRGGRRRRRRARRSRRCGILRLKLPHNVAWLMLFWLHGVRQALVPQPTAGPWPELLLSRELPTRESRGFLRGVEGIPTPLAWVDPALTTNRTQMYLTRWVEFMLGPPSYRRDCHFSDALSLHPY